MRAEDLMTDSLEYQHGHAAPIMVDEYVEEWDSKKMTSERKHAVYMRAFAVNLEDEGLRSPEYYHDKSQCLSFECISPAEMGIIKAQKLKQGYMEPGELISRLRELKPSDNFPLRKYRHPRMKWDKSPIYEKSNVLPPPASVWFLDQLYGIRRMERQLGRRCAERYKQEARKHWAQVCDIELTPLPDLHLLKDMGHSPSGTLFPRYLVKGLHELRTPANSRGWWYYDEEYEKAIVKRREVIHRWQRDNPTSVLAEDPISIYRTWPSALMNSLDALDREAMRRGSERYMADLVEVEKKMQILVAFWKDCGLITGQRTPPSAQFPDPQAKLRGVPWPQYLGDKIETLLVEFDQTKNREEYEKNCFLEVTRWKEAILNADSEPSALDTPYPESLLHELDLVWQDYDWVVPEETEDEMIVRISCWRRTKSKKPYPDRPRTGSPLPKSTELGDMVEKTKSAETMIDESSSHEAGEGLHSMLPHSLSVSTSNEVRPMLSPFKDQSSAASAKTVNGQIDSATLRASATSGSGNPCLLGPPSKKSRLWSRESPTGLEPVGAKSIWWGRLRLRKELLKSSNSPAKKPQGVMKRDTRGKPRRPNQVGKVRRPYQVNRRSERQWFPTKPYLRMSWKAKGRSDRNISPTILGRRDRRVCGRLAIPEARLVKLTGESATKAGKNNYAFPLHLDCDENGIPFLAKLCSYFILLVKNDSSHLLTKTKSAS